MDDPHPAAAALVDELAGDIRDERVLAAVAAVPRDRFVPWRMRRRAYDNIALPIGGGQTISQPFVVARMLELLELRGGERVLDIGTGSGYHAALLARLAGEVWTIERDPRLSARAERALEDTVAAESAASHPAESAASRRANVSCVVGDGWLGLPEHGPYDAINVAAATGPEVPEALVAQLALGGRLVAPVGTTGDQRGQTLTRLTRTADGIVSETFEPVRFVPLVRD